MNIVDNTCRMAMTYKARTRRNTVLVSLADSWAEYDGHRVVIRFGNQEEVYEAGDQIGRHHLVAALAATWAGKPKSVIELILAS